MLYYQYMAIPQKLINFFGKANVKYDVLKHRTVYTAYDKAATLRVPQKIIGKTLVVKLDPKGKPLASYGAGKNYVLVLIPANKNLDKEKLKKIAKAKKIDFAKEAWIKKNLKGVKVGAIPPLGAFWKLSTFAEKSLVGLPKIIINGGNYNFSIKLKGSALKKLIPDLITGSFSKAKK